MNGAISLVRQNTNKVLPWVFLVVTLVLLFLGTAIIGGRILPNPLRSGTELGLVSEALCVILWIGLVIYKITKSQNLFLRYIWLGMFSTTYVSLGIGAWLIMAGLSSYYK